jgi:hypothetical protein
MKNRIITLLALVFALPIAAMAQPQFNEEAVVDSLLTINAELRTKFPRWKVCEPDLQYQIYQAFKILKYDPAKLDLQNIEVLAAPKGRRDRFYEILLITCGDATMNAQVIESQIRTISRILSGREKVYERPVSGEAIDDERAYCFVEIPAERPPRPSEAEAIQDWLRPENEEQAITASLFAQSLKIGKTGFWLESKIGNDRVGYPWWTAGENKIILSRPLYNETADGERRFWDLISYHIGGVYRTTIGQDDDGESSTFDFLPQRNLNSEPNGKIIGGFDIHMPFEDKLGISLNLELPYQDATGTQIDDADFVIYNVADPRLRNGGNTPRQFFTGVGDSTLGVAPILRGTGQVTVFYNLWVNENVAENFFRFEAGLSYTEVQEYLAVASFEDGKSVELIDSENAIGLTNYTHADALDMLFLKATYRNQSVNPFEISTQLSNSILTVDGYLPLFGNWFLLQAKYATPLRDARYYEFDNFFMISPVIRITI